MSNKYPADGLAVRRSTWSVTMVVLGMLLVAAVPRAHAGMMSPCDDPIVLPGPRVQVFILPYRAESNLTDRGRELATIMQRHVLFAALKYQSIGVEELTATNDKCTIEATSAKVLARLKKGQAAIFLWGRLFEQGDAIRLQSTVTFTIPGVPDKLTWKVGAQGGEASKTSATIPPDPTLFASRVIPLYFLQTLQSAQVEARRMHSAPNATSPFWELPSHTDARFGFEVMETRDDWMHLRMFPGGGEGWVPAHALAGADNLKGAFPELYFIDGLIGYHELMTATAGADNRRLLDVTLASFDEYLRQASGRAESESRALATSLQGNAGLRATGGGKEWTTEQLQRAQNYYQAARTLAPTSTIANNFVVACASALCARGACAEGTDQLHAQFLKAIARDPTSPELVDNLNVFYAAVQNGQLKIAASPESVSAQRALVRQAQKSK